MTDSATEVVRKRVIEFAAEAYNDLGPDDEIDLMTPMNGKAIKNGLKVMRINLLPKKKKLVYKRNPKHGERKTGKIGAEPKNPGKVLKESIEMPGNTTRRIGIDKDTGEFVIFDEHKLGEFHGHTRSWSELTQKMQSVFRKAGLVSKKGKIIK